MRGIRKVKAGEKEATAHRSAALCFTVPLLQQVGKRCRYTIKAHQMFKMYNKCNGWYNMLIVYSTCHIMVDTTVWFGRRRPMT